jgi:hypothetical protein
VEKKRRNAETRRGRGAEGFAANVKKWAAARVAAKTAMSNEQ